MDGTKFNELLSKTKAGALAIKEVYGDKAYFRAKFLGTLKEANIAPYIPVSASAYRMDEALFSYNKDSDQWFCALGNETVSRRTCHTKHGGVYEESNGQGAAARGVAAYSGAIRGKSAAEER